MESDEGARDPDQHAGDDSAPPRELLAKPGGTGKTIEQKAGGTADQKDQSEDGSRIERAHGNLLIFQKRS
jgi:hypothetical protein